MRRGLGRLVRLLVVGTAVMLGARPAAAQIVFDAASQVQTSTGVLTWPHTIGSGTNRIVIAAVSIRIAGITVASATFAGTPMTSIGTKTNHDNAVRVHMYYLINPPVGTANLEFTLSGSAKVVGGAASFRGVDPTSPVGAFFSDGSTNTGTTDPTLVVTSAPGDVVVAALAVQGSAGTLTPGSGQTGRWNLFQGSSGGDVAGAGSSKAGSASVTVTWAKTGTAKWALGAVSLKPANTAPALDPSKAPGLGDVLEDAGAPSGAVGTLVSALVDFAVPSGQVDNVTDPDAGAVLGLAVTAADATNGTWWYSTTSGASWLPLGTPSNATARLLAADAGTRLYFQATANWNGTVASAITFRAWDRTSGTNGGTADATTSGGTSAFSTATDVAALTVTAVNDAPTLGNGTLTAIAEDTPNPPGQTLATLFAGQFADVDAGSSFGGVAVVGNTANATTQGSWQYSTDGGTTWAAIGTVADGATALALSAATRVRFLPVADYGGTPPALTVRGLDNSYAGGWSSTAGTESRVTVNTALNGGTTAIAAATATLSSSVTAVNDPPVITSNGGGATAAINVAENITAVTTGTATDVDGPSLTWSIAGGADAARFTINPTTGALAFVAAPDREAPADVGANNAYEVTIQASDGSLTDTQAITVAITPVNDNTPVITSGGGGVSAAVSAREGTTAVTTVTATDADLPAETLTFSLAGGPDAARFSINPSTGALTFLAAPSFAAPTDVGGNNVYDVTVSVSDGSLTDTQAIAVTVQGSAALAVATTANVPTPQPGQDVTFTSAHTSTGNIAATSLLTVTNIPLYTDFKLGTATFTAGTSGLTAVLAYSNNGGTSWSYVPVSGGGGAPAGYDRSVTHLRWTFTGALSPVAPNNSVSVSFQARVR